MRPVIVGSEALTYYFKEEFRKPKDLDIYISETDWACLDHTKLRSGVHKGASRFFSDDLELKILRWDWETPTDRYILDEANRVGRHLIKTLVGEAVVAPLELSAAIKLASQVHGDPKHTEDIDFLSKHMNMQSVFYRYEEFIERRKAEIAARKISREFFNKYTIPRWLEHDFLHVLVAAHYFGSTPAFKTVVNDEVEINESEFQKLGVYAKVKCVAEEAMVLALERSYIPGLSDGSLTNPKVMLPYSIHQLKRLAGSCGGIEDNPEWLEEWIRSKFNVIAKLIERKIHARTRFSNRMEGFLLPIAEGRAARIS